MRKILLIILIPIVILLTSYNSVVYDFDFYKSEFEKLNIYENEKLNIADVQESTYKIITYLDNGKPLVINFLNAKEVKHMEDVRYLHNILCYTWYVSIILLAISFLSLLYSKKYKDIYHALVLGGLSTIIFLLLILILASISFTSVFRTFHEVVFTNDLWQLDPQSDKLIQMFPEQFFYDALTRIMIFSVVASLVLILIGYLGKPKKWPFYS